MRRWWKLTTSAVFPILINSLMSSSWLFVRDAGLMILFAAVFLPSIANASRSGHDHCVSTELAQSPDDFDGIVIERRLNKDPVVISVPHGSHIQLRLTTPELTELHLHGYDLSANAGPQTEAVMTFHAEHAGRFAIVSHGGHDLLGRSEKALTYIEVLPE